MTPPLESLGRKVDDLVVGAAQLEGKNRLQIFALEQHPVADPRRERRCVIERGFDRDVVDPRSENSFEVVRMHGGRWAFV
jgi:hypothetical protein